MARPLRIKYQGAFYHIISRGERRENIFFDDRDRFKFLEKLGETAQKFNLKIHGYVLMDNHFHLLMETPDANLSTAMHHINTSYSNWFKSKHQIIGSVFQGRYKSILVEKDLYLLILSVYIHLNPVRAEIVEKPEEYKWSSFRIYMGGEKTISWIFTEDILKMFLGSREEYKEFVYHHMNKDNEIKQKDIRGKHSILGRKEFREKIMKQFKSGFKKYDIREKPDLKHLNRLTADDVKTIILKIFQIKEEELLIKTKNNKYRKLFLYGLRKYTQLSLREIGDLCGMDYVAVFQMVKRFISDSACHPELKIMLEKFEREILKEKHIEC